VIQEAAAIEHHPLDALLDGALGDDLADRLGPFRLPPRTPFSSPPLIDASTVDAETSVLPDMSSMTWA
jgi:hypothetical protein